MSTFSAISHQGLPGDDKVYRKMFIGEDKVIGCIMLGGTKGFNRATEALGEKRMHRCVGSLLR